MFSDAESIYNFIRRFSLGERWKNWIDLTIQEKQPWELLHKDLEDHTSRRIEDVRREEREDVLKDKHEEILDRIKEVLEDIMDH